MGKFRAIVLAGTVGVSAAFGANAAVLDFTSVATYNGTTNASGATGTINGLTWTLTPTVAGSMTYNFPSGNGALSGVENGFNGKNEPVDTGLAFEGDGVGQVDDEFSNLRQESLILSFDKTVRISGIHFLDLFWGIPNPESSSVKQYEQVNVFDTLTNTLLATLTGGEKNDINKTGGYTFGALDYTGKSLTFVTAGAPDDNDIDFAFAGANVAAVPLPAGGLLLLTAIGGLAVARRRKAV